MLMPEKNLYYINETTGIKVHCNRFNVWTHLSQHYYVEQLSRFMDSRVEHQKRLNSTHFKRSTLSSSNNDFDSSDSDSYESDTENNEDSDKKVVICGDCIQGSSRHLRKLSLNALHIVQTLDKPHIFLTLTCDSNWPEVHEKIEKSQSAFSRPDVTTMVFHERTEAILHNLRQGKYFKFTVDILTAKQYDLSTREPQDDIYTGFYNDSNQYHTTGKLEQTISNLKVVYTGNWINGTRHGMGELVQPYNVIYMGEFQNDIPNGFGSLKIQRSKVYSDNYEVSYGTSNIKISTVQVEDKNYTVESYTGIWKDGLLLINESTGVQRRIQYDGVIYYGSIDSSSVANGKGCLIFPDGTEYNETFKDNKVQVTNKVQYEMRVTEYQHRGLPHCHYVARLTNMPKAECMLSQWINENISTNSFHGFDNSNKESEEYKMKEIIRNKMLHKCSVITADNPRGCRKSNDDVTCKKFYHSKKESKTAYFDEKGYPQYKREKNDLKTVPYNPLILLDWEGHANLEFTEMSYAIGYLYKYIFKGNTKVQTEVTEGKKDEVSYYLKTRKICSMDAVNRFYGYPTYPSPTPTVITIKVKLASQMELILSEGNVCSLFVYFSRPKVMHNLKYTEFFQYYTYERKKNSKRKRSCEFYSRNKTNTKVVIKSRRESNPILVRLQGLSIKCGEICYLRMLLKHRAASSYDDLYTYCGIKYSTFQESAKQHGLLKSMEFLKEEFLEIFDRVNDCKKRRIHYAIWLSQDYPVNFMYNDGEYCSLLERDKDHSGFLYKEMVSDWILEKRSKSEISNMFLTEVDKYLNDSGLSNVTFGLPEPKIVKSEIDYEEMKYKPDEQDKLYKTLESTVPCNKLQQLFLDYFKQKFHRILENDDHEPVFIFLTGSGGTGKSTVLEKVAAYVRSQGCICKISAATALAASIYSDATTLHSLAKIPVVEQCDRELEYSIKLNLTEDRLSLLLETKVIIIDEVFFTHRECLEAIYHDSRLNGLKGKIILTAGDRKQFLPIAEGGTKHEQLSISLSSSGIWSLFKNNIFYLTENMRLTKSINMSSREVEQQTLYADTLEDIGNQTSFTIDAFKDENCSADEQIYKLHCDNKFIVRDKQQVDKVLDSSLSWLYESGFTFSAITSSAVIVGTNKLVDMWNKRIQNLNKNEVKIFYSTDYLADVDDDNGYIKEILSTKVLNSKNHSSTPPHELRLKVNDVCILTR